MQGDRRGISLIYNNVQALLTSTHALAHTPHIHQLIYRQQSICFEPISSFEPISQARSTPAAKARMHRGESSQPHRHMNPPARSQSTRRSMPQKK
eukprot:scaffold41475_cov63-Phaeocystis_antarctica.AAC.1